MIARELTASMISEEHVFSLLAEQWDGLVQNCKSSTPFQAHSWLNSWWRAYGTPGRLRVVLVHSGAELVAAVALHVRVHLHARTLLPVGAGLSDFCDVLVADAVDRADVVRVLGTALCEVGGWDVIDFPEVRPDAAAFQLTANWAARISCTQASTCLELPVQDVTDLAAGLPRSTAKHLRQKLRKLDEVGVISRTVAANDVPRAVAEFCRLHLAQWQGRGINPEHTRPRFRRFLTEALPLMVERGQALVAEYELDAELMGVRINVVGSSLMGAYLSGMSPALRNYVDVATLMLRHNMQLAQEHGTAVLSLLRGQEDYKLRWRPYPVLNQRVVLGRPGSVRALAYLTAANKRASATSFLGERAPWLKDLRTQGRSLLSR